MTQNFFQGKFRWTLDPGPVLQGLRDRVAQRILKKAVRTASAETRDDEKAGAPVFTSATVRSISTKIQSNVRPKVYARGIIGPRRGYEYQYRGRSVIPSHYFQQVLKGHGGPHPAPAHDWLSELVAQRIKGYNQTMLEVCGEEIQKEINKNGR